MKLLTGKDLRLGNYVYKHFEGGLGEVECVTARTIFDCQTNPTGKFSYSGIILNPDILWSAGFIKDGFGAYNKSIADFPNQLKQLTALFQFSFCFLKFCGISP